MIQTDITVTTSREYVNLCPQYRQWMIPCDGLHVDVDLQDNYRTFTHSKQKFPNPKEMFDTLHDWGYKCSTNITPIISCNVDENGDVSPYKALDSGKTLDVFVKNKREDGSGSDEHYIGKCCFQYHNIAFCSCIGFSISILKYIFVLCVFLLQNLSVHVLCQAPMQDWGCAGCARTPPPPPPPEAKKVRLMGF